ncbi:hypothetical protein [Escherichia coli]|uniref:hypothetical protein n=1 Tax=Escherichia coli TaxID=562 RepID=UPI003515ED98
MNWCRILYVRKLANGTRWSFAIHNPKASIDGGEQPHAHIMMSQRVNDGIENVHRSSISGAITPGIPTGEVRKRIPET